MKKLGFIGMGNMAKALAKGFIDAGKIKENAIFAYAPNQEKLQKNSKRIGFIPVTDPKKLVETVDTVIMACKPHQIPGVLEEIREDLQGKALISIAAGWDFATYQEYFTENAPFTESDFAPDKIRLQFVMPNTPAMVREGVLLFEETNSLSESERDEIMDLFAATGRIEQLPSSLMGIGGAISGCGPAFIDVIMEAYGDAGVKFGLPRDQAYALVAQMIRGAAQLQLSTGIHPAVLKDQVCSPGGTTIGGVTALEETGMRNACIKSIEAIVDMLGDNTYVTKE